MNTLLRLVLFLALGVGSQLVAATNDPVTAAQDKIAGHRVEIADEKRVLAPGDRISYRVIEDGNNLISLLITDTGEAEIPYLGRVPLAGKTPGQARQEIKRLLEAHLYKQASVVLAIELLSKTRGKVYLVGKVKVPGPVDLTNDEELTVSKAILKAGGFAEFANQRKVKVIRNSTGDIKSEGEVVDVAAIWEKGSTRDLKLEAGDLIYVPSKLVNF